MNVDSPLQPHPASGKSSYTNFLQVSLNSSLKQSSHLSDQTQDHRADYPRTFLHEEVSELNCQVEIIENCAQCCTNKSYWPRRYFGITLRRTNFVAQRNL